MAIRGDDLDPYERTTLTATFLGAVERCGDLPALRWFQAERWHDLSYRDAADRVGRVAAWLLARGIQPGDRVGILSENRPEWALFDYAALCLGAVTVPIYPTLPADQAGYILRDAGARGVIVSSAAQLAKIQTAREELPALEWVVVLDEGCAGAEAGWADLLATSPLADLPDRARRASPADLATLVYTSGTTGSPKGVMLSHGNFAYMVAATAQHGSVPAGTGDVCLSILPLSHVFERAAAYFFWDRGVTIAYGRSIETLAEDLLEIRPHVMVSVPRLFEKLHGRIVHAGGVRGRLGRWAAATAGRVKVARDAGQAPSPGDQLRLRVADRTVFAMLRRRTGGRLRGFICGGAPLSEPVATFFFAAGLPIYEGYGLTETSPVLAANRPGQVRLGTVGVPYPGVEIRIGDEGEILARGPGIMTGYWQNPIETTRVLESDGWFHTGDVGEVDADGFLRITDRLKDLIITAGGKNIAPQPVESRITTSPYIAQAVMIGDRRAFPVLLVVPDWAALEPWAAEQGVDLSDREAAARDPRLLELMNDETSARIEHLARHEVPRRFSLLPTEFTVDDGLLTPTLKVRRRAVEQAFDEAVERLYVELEHLRVGVRNLTRRGD
jgi:long-chain acyl-CoA synthetase